MNNLCEYFSTTSENKEKIIVDHINKLDSNIANEIDAVKKTIQCVDCRINKHEINTAFLISIIEKRFTELETSVNNRFDMLKIKNRKLKLATRIYELFMGWAIPLLSQYMNITCSALQAYATNGFFLNFVNRIYLDVNEDIFKKRSGKMKCSIPDMNIDKLICKDNHVDRIFIWSYKTLPWYMISIRGKLQLSNHFKYVNSEIITSGSFKYKVYIFKKSTFIARLAIFPHARNAHYFRIKEEKEADVDESYKKLNVNSGYESIKNGFVMLELPIL